MNREKRVIIINTTTTITTRGDAFPARPLSTSTPSAWWWHDGTLCIIIWCLSSTGNFSTYLFASFSYRWVHISHFGVCENVYTYIFRSADGQVFNYKGNNVCVRFHLRWLVDGEPHCLMVMVYRNEYRQHPSCFINFNDVKSLVSAQRYWLRGVESTGYYVGLVGCGGGW